jgi:hypothetical protein
MPWDKQRNMRHVAVLIFALLTFSAFGQNYPFAKEFVNGSIILKDSSRKMGQVKWFPHQNEKLKFRETENAETIKYSPEEIAGFIVDTLSFISVYNLDVYSDNYALLGKPSKIKHTFAQVVDTGKFNIYLALIAGNNAISGDIQVYPNFLFQNPHESSLGFVAYPFAIRMKDKKYDKAKETLYVLFKDYPDIVEKLRNYKQQDDFFEIINLVKAVNR